MRRLKFESRNGDKIEIWEDKTKKVKKQCLTIENKIQKPPYKYFRCTYTFDDKEEFANFIDDLLLIND